VARRAGVSIATVSRVVNGVATVDAALAERVRAACAALQYQPNRAARALAGHHSAIIGLLVADLQNPFFMEIVRGVEDVAQRNGYLVVLCNSTEDPHKERAYIEVLCAEAVAGAIVAATTDRKPIVRMFEERGIPVVAVDRRVRDRSIDAVLIDNVTAAREAVAHLIANGYRRIGAITGPQHTTTARERLEGYRLALSDAGILIDPQLERSGSFNADSGRQLAGELLDLAPPVEALFAGNNRIAQGALQALHVRNLRVPDDIAVVGFDEVPWAIPGTLSLTTVTQPAYELGSTAALRLLQRLQHPGQVVRQAIVLAHQLHIGDSSRPREHSSATAVP
jgi:DNA-binding LacI/PurR family transcriptional regulator